MKKCSLPITGAYQKPARQLLLACCREAYNDLSSDRDMLAIGQRNGWDIAVRKSMAKLPRDIDNWLAARNEWTENFSHDGVRQYLYISTAQMLIDWADIVSNWY